MPKEETLDTNSSLKLSRWMHAYGQLLWSVVTTLYVMTLLSTGNKCVSKVG